MWSFLFTWVDCKESSCNNLYGEATSILNPVEGGGRLRDAHYNVVQCAAALNVGQVPMLGFFVGNFPHTPARGLHPLGSLQFILAMCGLERQRWWELWSDSWLDGGGLFGVMVAVVNWFGVWCFFVGTGPHTSTSSVCYCLQEVRFAVGLGDKGRGGWKKRRADLPNFRFYW